MIVMMLVRAILIMLVIFFLLLAPAIGQEEAVVRIPDTPAGRQLTKLLHAIESGDHEKYIKENFSQSFLEAFPLEDHLDFFRQVKRKLSAVVNLGSSWLH